MTNTPLIPFAEKFAALMRAHYILGMTKLTQDQCLSTISNGEVPEEILNSNTKVAVILTQSWCGDWIIMRRYARKIDIADVSIYYIEYDREPFYESMRTFKEVVFKNWSVPYVRYYREGLLVGTSNLIFFKRGFLKKFER